MSSSEGRVEGGQPKSVSLSSAEGVATIGLSRPPLNILNSEMIDELLEAFAVAATGPGTKALLLKSDVDGTFSAGADVKDHLPPQVDSFIRRFEELISATSEFPWPTVAAVSGRCLGGGMELAMACDFVVAEEGSTFGQPEINLGVFPPAAASIYPRLVGPKAAADIVLTGRNIGAEEAQRMGLITAVAGRGALDSKCGELLDALKSKSGAALRLTKRAIHEGISLPLDAALRKSSTLYLEELMKTSDAQEGLSAFLEKRRPQWQNR